MKLYRALALGLGLAFAISCRSSNSSGSSSDITMPVEPRTVWLNQWDPANERTWYTSQQGSQLMDWDMFNALEAADSSALFAARSNLERYGFIYAPGADEASLPLGFIKDTSILDGKDYIGFNCAACHTGKYVYDGKTFLVHAGNAVSEIDRFMVDLNQALTALDDKSKLERFGERLASAGGRSIGSASFQADLAKTKAWVNDTKRNLVTIFPGGPGRLDAVSWIMNTVTATQIGIPGNWHQPTAPVAYPHLWTAPDLSCVQTDCLVTDPIPRNVGEVLGVFGQIDLKGTSWIAPKAETIASFLFKGNLFKSSVKVSNLYGIEESLRVLKAPTWPKEFPSVDPALSERGRTVYRENCETCHVNLKDGIKSDTMTEANKFGRQLVKVNKVDFREVGTDPTYMFDHHAKRMKPGVLAPLMLLGFSKDRDENGEYPGIKGLGLATLLTSEKYFLSQEFRDLAKERYLGDKPLAAAGKLKEEFHNYRDSDLGYDGNSYKARPLNGIAFSAPYFHNGSVLTLADVLAPPEARLQNFRLGDSLYDVNRVGLLSSGHFNFDTTLRGNSNAGHTYGTNLDGESKKALLEYLKTL